MLSASTAVEEKHWKTEILKCSAALAEMAKPGGTWDPHKYSFMSLELVPLNRIQYATATLARRSSMDSMAVSRKPGAQEVIIKKTHFPHSLDEAANPAGTEIERPNVPPARGFVTVTARRIERIRLERQITDVYTKDVLPLPGMVLGRGDLFKRGSLMRRLSFHHAGFNRRSVSVSTTHSGPVVTETRSVVEYDGEEKELMESFDGANDQHIPQEGDCGLPKTPSPTSGHTKMVRFRSATKKSPGSASSRGEKRGSQESNREVSPTRRKWTSPLALLSVFHRRT